MADEAGNAAETPDLREQLIADADGTFTHALVARLLARSKECSEMARQEPDAQLMETARQSAQVFSVAAHVVETAATRLSRGR